MNDDLPTEDLPKDLRSPEPGGAAPSFIGPYHLLSRLGEGGMGEVWEAEQITPVRRRVAIKIIKRGLDSKEVVARFEAERQALAMMNHPAIAKVFEAGQTERGRPYFVMELVKGVPINEYCDRHRLSNRERLAIFAGVCEGVQHAHQKAVIHRDIKPSNVLVTEHDGKPQPKIIDFGVAKAIAQRLSEKTLFTEQGQLLGTPEFMSPEQAEMTGEDIDTRTDVYALGVLLYVLLVGALPFESRELRSAGYDEIRRRIREVEPPRPSTRLSSLGDRSSTCAKARRTDPSHLVSELRGDLDWITMKAMEKDRNRRYGSPSDLAADLHRYLGDEPILARPPSAHYRLRKFVRRHRTGVAAAFVTALGLVIGLSAATWGWVHASRAEADARREAATARRVSEFLVDLFEQSDPGQSRGAEITAREILDQGAEAIRSELEDEPQMRASLLETLGEVHISLGLFDDAQPLLEEALGLREAEQTTAPLVLSRTLDLLANDQLWRGDLEEGLLTAQRAVAIRERELGPDHPDVAATLNTLGNLYEQSGELELAQETHARAAAIREQALGPNSPELARSLHNLGIAYLQQSEYQEAEKLLRRSADIEERTGGRDNHNLATSLHVLAIVYQNLGRFDEALVSEREALEIREQVLGSQHAHVAFSLTTLAELLQESGDPMAAEPLLRRAVAIGESVWNPLYPEVRWMQRTHAASLDEIGRSDEAEAILLRLLELTEETGDEEAMTPTLNAIGRHYTKMGRASDARAALERSLEIDGRLFGPEHPYVVQALLAMIDLERETGNTAQADELCERTLRIVESALPPEDPERRSTEETCR